MDKWKLKRRTKRFALRVIRFVSSLNSTTVTRVMGYQLMKAGASIGANYREANRAVSRADFLNKIGIAAKEAAETQYWIELFEEAGIGDAKLRAWLLQESGELLAIFSSIGKTTKSRG